MMTSLLELAESWAKVPTVLIASDDPATTDRLWSVLRHFDCDVHTQLMPDKTYGAAFVDAKVAPLLMDALKRKRTPVVVLLDKGSAVPLDFAPLVVLSKSAITLDRVAELTALLQLRAPLLARPAPQLMLAGA